MKLHFSELNKGQPMPFLLSIVTPLVVALLLVPSPGAALKCVSCSSKDTHKCLGGDLESFIMPCVNGEHSCRKWHFFFDEMGKGNVTERVVRKCGVTFPGDMCTRGFGASGKRFKRVVCDCQEDGCNTAATVKVNVITVCSVVLSLAMFFSDDHY